ncbi:putative heterokaryon incompatibility protein [Botrytis fragariae]|uniref:Putative heterokaryon incompatibility protein n=1 Tax=Botrytis fragariae TaxID=1964551 RepID=A0A8H6EG12_9HELO|nr:putative heterokaryon incompatibility protein [Botrytis fragariae]KAF5870555.1 putative heterokaryon incompatibility protein [Botrytis fragariae]
MFCETCVDLFRTIGEAQAKSRAMNGYKVPGKFTHRSTYDAFQKALSIGCYMCKRLWMYIESLCNDPDFVAKGFAAFESFCRWSMKYPEVKIVFEFPKTINVYEADSIVPVDPSKNRLLLPGYYETTNTGSDACFTLANNWLETCLSSYRSCKRYRPSVLKEWTPNHLICVKNMDAIVLCLHETGKISLGMKYATLSHCWGKIPDAQRLLLMRDNIDSWTRGMPNLQSMKTFDHAITICQKLGLDYIWIDSLCIIQDSQDDWHQRASLMDRVYKYSQCTITATAAENDTVGCFFDRDVNICLPSRVKFVQKSTYLPDATKGPTSESTYRPEGSKPMDLTFSINSLGELTKGSEKLVAISTIAREVQPLIRSRYLAGLWEVDLVFQLAWWSRRDGFPSTMYQAPSWSWASIDGQVLFDNELSPDLCYPLVEILEAVTCLVGEDECGQVQGSHLNLLGQMIDFELLDEEEKSGRSKVLCNGELNFAMI